MPRMPALPAQQRQPSRGPVNGLHMAARNGSIDHIVSLLSGGAIDIDQGSPRGFTPLMYAAQEGRSQVARVLISRGANVTLSADGGVTALHFCSEKGHAMVTNDLVHAGADVEARRHDRGPTPLFLAAQSGHLGVMKVLIKAGANVDCRLTDGTSALAQAASIGHLDTVRELIRGNANPTLTRSGSWGFGVLPLDAAATKGHSEVVRELINRFGIRGCGGASGGNTALAGAAMEQHIETMVILVSAGVVDDFPALYQAAARGREASVKFLLQQQQKRSECLLGYVNQRDSLGVSPLSGIIDGAFSDYLCSPRVLRLLINAHLDTASVVCLPSNCAGQAGCEGTPLALVNRCLREKKRPGRAATEEHLHRLQGVRRLLIQAEAVHATSWLWCSWTAVRANRTAKSAAKTASVTGTSLTAMLPVLRRRARRQGGLLATLLRHSEKLG